MRKVANFVAVGIVMLCPVLVLAQDTFRDVVADIIKDSKGTVGVAAAALDRTDTLFINGNKKLPMQSVFKFPLAMAMLDQIDKGKFSLDQKIKVTKKELLQDMHSPMREKYPEGGEIALSEILAFTVSQSDNSGCDIMFRMLGGCEKVNAYVHLLGVADISIVATEEEMHRDWKIQYTNYSTPAAMLQLLGIFYQGKHLSKASNDFLWKIMVETTTGPEKIKGMLPVGTLVAHKTGYSGANDKGLIGASNDVGIVRLPNGQFFAISVFVSDSSEPTEKCSQIIARISRAAWEHYSFVKE